jgi:hypothetical protein
MTKNHQATMPKAKTKAEPIIMRKRIGSTTFEVAVYFSGTDRDKTEDKVFRLIESEVRKLA